MLDEIIRLCLRRNIALYVLLIGLGLLIQVGCQKELGDIGAECIFSADCKDTLRCMNGFCGVGGGENAPCSQTTECETNLTCVKGQCKFDGDSCSSDSDCSGDKRCSGKMCLKPSVRNDPCLDTKGCIAPLVCNANGRCADSGSAGTGKEGDTCKALTDCQRGLSCTEGTCQLGGKEGSGCKNNLDCDPSLVCANNGKCTKPGEPGTIEQGKNCKFPQDCQAGLTCAANGQCAPEGATPRGSPCAGNQACAPGLLCAQVKGEMLGKCEKPGEPGTKQTGENCTNHEECSFGMICGFDKTCAILRSFDGVSCEDPEKDKGDFRLLFQIPRSNRKLNDFYQLPYPNDIRKQSNGRLDLAGYPNPGPLLGEDLIGKYIQAAQGELSAWGLNQTVVLRFSKRIDFGTVVLRGDKPAILFINLDNGERIGVSVHYNSGRTPYLCHNHLLVRPFLRVPLAHGQTYAVVITNVIRSSDDELIKRDADFSAMIANQSPEDNELTNAHESYKKLRGWLEQNASEGKWPTPSSISGAAVFTTQDPDANFAKFREVIYKQPQPKIKDLTLCKEGVKSPCDSDKDVVSRACGKSDGHYHEFHARITLPIFQQGTPPFEKEGGNILYQADGTPDIATTRDVCMAITIPKGEAPPDGWPLLIYAHGTGGNFRSHIADKTAERVANLEAHSKKTGFATIGIDQVVHGDRRGDSQTHPDFLFFNFRNPSASLNNPIQNAVDQFTLVRWAQTFAINAQDSPIQTAISFDKERYAFLGHSQGGFIGPLFLAYEPLVKTAILSGAGGNLTQSLLNKSSPVDIASGVRAMLGEAKVDQNHPILNLFQLYFDRADPINYAHLIARQPLPDLAPKHILQTYGTGDTFSPPATMQALAFALGVEHAGDKQDEISGLTDKILNPPVKGNLNVNGKPVTAVFTQYKPGDYDGHFVIFQHADAIKHFSKFLATFAIDPEFVPTIEN
jgi:pimeloyl-ACP methyl ester carboxylesterase